MKRTITAQDAKEIRLLVLGYKHMSKCVAACYGVSVGTVLKITAGASWQNVKSQVTKAEVDACVPVTCNGQYPNCSGAYSMPVTSRAASKRDWGYRLGTEDVRAIRLLILGYKHLYRCVADRYDIGEGTVHNIVHGRSRQHPEAQVTQAEIDACVPVACNGDYRNCEVIVTDEEYQKYSEFMHSQGKDMPRDTRAAKLAIERARKRRLNSPFGPSFEDRVAEAEQKGWPKSLGDIVEERGI